jgi:putative transposase
MLLKDYGSGSTCHRRFQEWTVSKIFQRLWIRLLEVYDDLRGIGWKWQSLDSASVKAPLGGTLQVGPNPTDRGKIGKKHHVLTDRPRWHSIIFVITPANTHDMKAAKDTLDSVIVHRETVM